MGYSEYIYKLRLKLFDAYKDNNILQALLVGERILRLYQDNENADFMEYPKDLYNVAGIYYETGKFTKAVELYTDACNYIDARGEVNKLFTDILNNLAVCYNKIGDNNTALSIYMRNLEYQTKLFGAVSEELSNTYYNMGNSCYDLEQYETAISYFFNSMALRIKKDLLYTDILNCIGYSYEAMDELDEAIGYFTRALKFIKVIEGSDSEEYLSNLYYLASVYEKNEQDGNALNAYEYSISLIKRFTGEKHPYYAEALNKLAGVYSRLNNRSKSLMLRIKALNIIKDIVGENHIYYANCLKSVADIYYNSKDYTHSCPLYEEQLKITGSLLGKNSSEYAKDSITLSKTYFYLGETEKAIEFIKDVIENLDENNQYYLKCILTLAMLYMSVSNMKDLYYLYEKYGHCFASLTFDEMLIEAKDISEIEFEQSDNKEEN